MARTNNSTGEVALVVLGTLANGLVDVDVAVLREEGLDVELVQTAKLKLEGKGRLNVTDGNILLVVGATEGEVAGVGALLVAADERKAAHAAVVELLLVLIDNWQDAGENDVVVNALGVLNGNVADGREFVLAL